MLRDLYSKHPEMRYLQPWELQSALFILGYTDELLDEWEIDAADETARKDFLPGSGRMSRVIRCAVCTRRIKSHHPHIGLLDLEPGRGLYSYHARCGQRGAQEIASLLERGKAYVLRHYHSTACPEERLGGGCSGGCFDPLAGDLVAN